jgi:hypothetical protein
MKADRDGQYVLSDYPVHSCEIAKDVQSKITMEKIFLRIWQSFNLPRNSTRLMEH